MDGEALRQMRIDFGVTQEALADELGVTPRTVQRWEQLTTAQRALNATRIGRALTSLARVNGGTTKRYAHALVPNEIIMVVTHCPTAAFLTYGHAMTVVAISDGSRARWPNFPYFMGADLLPILVGEVKKFYSDYGQAMVSLREGKLVAIKVVLRSHEHGKTDDDASDYRITFTSPATGLMRSDVVDIPHDEYLQARGEVEIIE